MDVSSMLDNDAHQEAGAAESRRSSHQYPTRHAASTQDHNGFAKPSTGPIQRPAKNHTAPAGVSGYGRASPAKKNQKHVVFQLIDHEDPRIQARLPMRVMISTHDTTDGIISTVKNFYGLYEYGVSFENKDGINLIAAYENFEHDMTVYVRAVAQKSASVVDDGRDSASPKKPTLGAPFEMRPPQHHHNNSPLRSGARSAGVRSMSPQSDVGRRSASVAPGGKPRPQRTKSKDNSMMGDGEGYSSGDNGGGSVASSRRSKQEVVNPEISTDNIVEGGRRKRAFESSELPLFVPPQVPMSTSISSISPQRRAGPPSAISPYPYSNQATFSYTQPLPSPQSYGSGAPYGQPSTGSNGYNAYNPQGNQYRPRPGAPISRGRYSGSGILPTPDPTVGSAISDEDVALQLMRLGDPMAFSHGRTSTSTVDDAMSGKADAASSDEESDVEDANGYQQDELPTVPHYGRDSAGGPPRKKARLMADPAGNTSSGEDYDDHRDATFAGSDGYTDHHRKPSKPKQHSTGHHHRSSLPSNNHALSANKHTKPRANSLATKPKTNAHKSLTYPMSSSTNHNPHNAKIPMSPAPSAASRKGSIASAAGLNTFHQHAFNGVSPSSTSTSLSAFPSAAGVSGQGDEEDLSTKPRCQRCRKSKKGCDRQRPCGRCKDAGIGIEGCISEDEGNGRKGRYGRHMGVSVQRAEEGVQKTEGGFEGYDEDVEQYHPMQMQIQGGIANGHGHGNGAGVFLAPALPEKAGGKKRKR